MKPTSTVICAVISTVALVATASTALGEGRTEINQASVTAAGGFPYTISQAGNYVLTSDLSVPAVTNGLVIDAEDVRIDLNGFHVAGPFDCQAGSCPGGTGRGISISFPWQNATVRNGHVSGFEDRCVILTEHARVEDLRVSDCGRTGITVNSDSFVMRNLVYDTGDTGIQMSGTGTVFAHNTVADADLRNPGTSPATQGGSATAGNVCDDGTCSPTSMRRYYLTSTSHDGSTAGSACTAGFHVASLWELYDPSSVHYEPAFGVAAGKGTGPPIDPGWVYFLQASVTCSDWTSTAGSGVYINLNASQTAAYGPWSVTQTTCTNSFKVWCIED